MIKPVNDSIKVLVDDSDPYNFGTTESGGAQTGIVVEVPDIMLFLAFHSFAFEQSIANDQVLEKVRDYYNQFLNKRIYWEALKDSGRKMKDGDKSYVYLKMTDILAVADDINDEAYLINQLGSAGSFNLS